MFDRLPNQEMVLKEYYYPNQERSNGLHVNERHLSGEYALMVLSNQIMEHNGIQYKAQSLREFITQKEIQDLKTNMTHKLLKVLLI